jgi:4-amino-4-deoxy-L-arabinose transferase-like glycosyltransferase
MSRKTAFYSTLFFTFIPLNIYYSTISHVESTISFFALLSLYLLVKKRFYWAAIASGIGCLSKYSMFWMFPLLIYVLFREHFSKTIASFSRFIWKTAVFFFITLVIGFPWYVRNLINLGNPVYHFLNGIFIKLGFHPYMSEAMINIPDYNIFRVDYFIKAYLDLFGVPLGLPSNLFSLKLPLMPLPVIGWVALTAVFFVPLVIGLFSMKKGLLKNITLIWLISFILMIITYLIPEHQMFLRLFLPAIPALAVLWGFGAERVFGFKMSSSLKGCFVILIALCIVVFSACEIFKAGVGASQYKVYGADFSWVKENTPKSAVFYPYSIVLCYYLDRFVAVNYTSADYYFESGLAGKREPVPEEALERDFEKVYENKATEVMVYKKK